VQQAPRVTKVYKVLLEPWVNKDLKESRVIRVIKVIKAIKVTKEFKEFREVLDQRLEL
jgi:hypothetical protein